MYLSINHSIYLCICLSASLKRKLFCETFELDNVKNEASLRDFFSFWTWKRQKWKTKQVCETSSIFARDNIKNEGILGNFLSAELTASYQNAIFPVQSMCLKYCACHEKGGQATRSAAPVAQNHLSKPEGLMLQNATPLKKSALWPPNISAGHVSCTGPAMRTASLQIRFECLTPANVFEIVTKPDLWLRRVEK